MRGVARRDGRLISFEALGLSLQRMSDLSKQSTQDRGYADTISSLGFILGEGENTSVQSGAEANEIYSSVHENTSNLLHIP